MPLRCWLLCHEYRSKKAFHNFPGMPFWRRGIQKRTKCFLADICLIVGSHYVLCEIVWCWRQRLFLLSLLAERPVPQTISCLACGRFFVYNLHTKVSVASMVVSLRIMFSPNCARFSWQDWLSRKVLKSFFMLTCWHQTMRKQTPESCCTPGMLQMNMAE